MKRSTVGGFTLLELLVAIAIIGILASLVAPQVGQITARARSVSCTSNLRQIGIGVLSYVADNENKYPVIEPGDTDAPVYLPEDEAEPIFEALEPYGVTQSVLKCPTDIRKNPSWYEKRKIVKDGVEYGTSYQWRPILDDELATGAKIYGGRRGAAVRIARLSRVTICTDFEAIHSGRFNRLYADGHVSKPQ